MKDFLRSGEDRLLGVPGKLQFKVSVICGLDQLLALWNVIEREMKVVVTLVAGWVADAL